MDLSSKRMHGAQIRRAFTSNNGAPAAVAATKRGPGGPTHASPLVLGRRTYVHHSRKHTTNILFTTVLVLHHVGI